MSSEIPEAAVEVAAKAIHRYDVREGIASSYAPNKHHRAEARAMLEAAAPHLRAQTAALIADGMQAWAGDSERAYVQGFAEAAWGKVEHQ